MKISIIATLALLFSSTSFAQDDHFIGKTSERAPISKHANKNPRLIPGVFDQLIDHANGTATFNQRYWIDSEYASGLNAPVLYHICGEGNAEEGYFLNDNAVEGQKRWVRTWFTLSTAFTEKVFPMAISPLSI